MLISLQSGIPRAGPVRAAVDGSLVSGPAAAAAESPAAADIATVQLAHRLKEDSQRYEQAHIAEIR